MDKIESVEFIRDKFRNADGVIDLSELDFGDDVVVTSGMRAKEIIQSKQIADSIYQHGHRASFINQGDHVVDSIVPFILIGYELKEANEKSNRYTRKEVEISIKDLESVFGCKVKIKE